MIEFSILFIQVMGHWGHPILSHVTWNNVNMSTPMIVMIPHGTPDSKSHPKMVIQTTTSVGFGSFRRRFRRRHWWCSVHLGTAVAQTETPAPRPFSSHEPYENTHFLPNFVLKIQMFRFCSDSVLSVFQSQIDPPSEPPSPKLSTILSVSVVPSARSSASSAVSGWLAVSVSPSSGSTMVEPGRNCNSSTTMKICRNCQELMNNYSNGKWLYCMVVWNFQKKNMVQHGPTN